MTRLRLAAAGDNCIDRFLTQNIARVGGNGLNVAVHFALAGHHAAYFGAVGDDADGRWTRSELEARGVAVDHLEIRPELTAYTDIAHTPEGDRQFLFEEFGASGAYFPSETAGGRCARWRICTSACCGTATGWWPGLRSPGRRCLSIAR